MDTTDGSESKYLRHLFLMEEGQDVFHEHVHYWQHVGTTFGAFQLISFLIVSKAMSIALRALIREDELNLPITSSLVERLEPGSTKSLVARAFEFASILEKYEIQDWYARIPLPNPRGEFSSGLPPNVPVFPLTAEMGVPLGALAIAELHNVVLSRIRKTHSLVGPTERSIIQRITEVLGPGCDKQIAYLCDWALMSPNPNKVKTSGGEAYPAWRFLRGVEALANAGQNKTRQLDSYKELTRWVTGTLSWHGPDTVMSHYETFIELALEQAANVSDARRNRKTYKAIARLLTKARDVREKLPEAFALPHLYESVLKEEFLPPGRKEQDRGILRTEESKAWYRTYLTYVSMVLQAFRSTQIRCVYRHLGVEDACRHLHENAPGNKQCFSVPFTPGAIFIECEFYRFWTELVMRMQEDGGKTLS